MPPDDPDQKIFTSDIKSIIISAGRPLSADLIKNEYDELKIMLGGRNYFQQKNVTDMEGVEKLLSQIKTIRKGYDYKYKVACNDAKTEHIREALKILP